MTNLKKDDSLVLFYLSCLMSLQLANRTYDRMQGSNYN